jgi:uncharacterized damage-inducible protein DinB
MLGTTMLTAMVEYHRQVNERLLDLAARLPEADLDAPIDGGRSIRETFRHMVDTDYRWRTFVETHVPVWEDQAADDERPGIATIAARQAAETAALTAWLARQREGDLLQEIEITWEGETSRITPWHGLLQMLLHGQQHRSELAAALTRCGQSPNDLDFIMYV